MRGAQAAIAGQAAAPASAAGAQAGALFGGKFGKKIKALIGPALVTGAAVGLANIGDQFDQAFDTIRSGTGATGDALEGLKDDFRDVVASVPTDFGSASTAVADLNTRLGLTGGPLQAMSAQMLELSRITETDLGTNIKEVTRAFGDWSVPTDQMSVSLDKLFRASQATGAPVDQLARSITDFGSPLRTLGFSMDESIALFGRFEKEGVNTSKVMAGMTLATSNLSNEAVQSATGVSTFGEVLQGVKEGTFDLADANKVFGKRAGVDILRAIQEGRFELADYLDVINGGSDTVLGVAEDTRSWRESLEVLKNNGLLLIEPVAIRVFDLLSKGSDIAADVAQAFREDGLAGAMRLVREQFDALSGPMQIVVTAIGGLAIAGAIAGGVALLGAAFGVLSAPIVLIPLALVAVGAALVWAYNRFEGFRQVVDSVAGFLVDVVWPKIQEFAQFVAGQFSNLVAWVRANWDDIRQAVSNAVGLVWSVVQGYIAVITAGWRAFGDDLLGIIDAAWSFIRQSVENTVNVIKGVIDIFIGVFTGDWSRAWEGVKGIFGAVMNQIGNIARYAWELIKGIFGAALSVLGSIVSAGLSAVLGFFASLPGRIVGALGALGGMLLRLGSAALRSMRDGAVAGFGALRDFLVDIPGRIKGLLGDVSGLLLGAGKAIIRSLLDGLTAGWGEVAGWVGGVAGRIQDLKGPIDKDRVLLVPEGNAIMEGLATGLKAGYRLDVVPALDAMTAELATREFTPADITLATAPLASAPGVRTGVAGGETVFNFISARQLDEALVGVPVEQRSRAAAWLEGRA